MISHKYKFIFFHVPKAAGTSIIKGFKENLNDDVIVNEDDPKLVEWLRTTEIVWPNHIPPSYLYAYLDSKEIFNNYFKFAFVRHPYSLLISMYHYAKQRETKIYKASNLVVPSFTQNILDSDSFSSWIKSRNFGSPQFDFLRNEHGLMVDFIGKTENLQSDIDHICHVTNIPTKIQIGHDNKSTHNSWDQHINSELADIIYSYFQKDFEYFNYKKKL